MTTNQGWRPRLDAPIGYVMVSGQRLPVRLDPAWQRYLSTLGDRIGGPAGASVPEVQAQVTAQANANAEALAVTKSVLVDAAIPGAEDIPPPVLGDGTAIP